MDTSLPILAIGHRFNTMKELCIACKHVAVSEHFEFKVQKSDTKRYRIHCISSDGCPWLLHASLITSDGDNSKIVEIKTFIAEHTCNSVCSAHHQQAGVALISSAIQGRLRDQGWQPGGRSRHPDPIPT